MDALDRGNTVEETDEAMLRLGMPMPPSVLLAMVGPRVAYHVLETMHEAYPDRFPLSPWLAALAAGRRARRESRPTAQVEEITDAALEAMADEIRPPARRRRRRVGGGRRHVLLLGAGFPFFLGGITKHLDQTGDLAAGHRRRAGRRGDGTPDERAR